MMHRKSFKIPTGYEMTSTKITDRAERPETEVAVDVSRASLSHNASYLRRVRAGLSQADQRNFVPDQDMEALFARLNNGS